MATTTKKVAEVTATEKRDLMRKLQAKGMWEEASAFKEGERKRLRGEGVPRVEANATAWHRMQEKYQIGPEEVPIGTMEEFTRKLTAPEPREEEVPPDWMIDNIDVVVDHYDAASVEDWIALQWQRRDATYDDTPSTPEAQERRRAEADEVMRLCNLARSENVTDRIAAEAGGLMLELEARYGAALSNETRESIERDLTDLVESCSDHAPCTCEADETGE